MRIQLYVFCPIKRPYLGPHYNTTNWFRNVFCIFCFPSVWGSPLVRKTNRNVTTRQLSPSNEFGLDWYSYRHNYAEDTLQLQHLLWRCQHFTHSLSARVQQLKEEGSIHIYTSWFVPINHDYMCSPANEMTYSLYQVLTDSLANVKKCVWWVKCKMHQQCTYVSTWE